MITSKTYRFSPDLQHEVNLNSVFSQPNFLSDNLFGLVSDSPIFELPSSYALKDKTIHKQKINSVRISNL